MKKGGNANHPKKGDRIAVEPIRKIKDIKAISKLTSSNPRDHLLFIMGINNGLRAGDLIKLKVKQVRYLKVGDTLTIKEGKTGKDNILVINKTVYKALKNIWMQYSQMMMYICSQAGRVIITYRVRPSVS